MKRKILKWNNQAGMTLIELLAAITILAIIIGPIFQLTLHAYTSYVDDQQKVKSLAIAQQKMEEAKVNETWITSNKSETNYVTVDSNTDDTSTYFYKTMMKKGNNLAVNIRVEVYLGTDDTGDMLTYLITEVSDPNG